MLRTNLVKIEGCNFTQNFGGQKGSAINIESVNNQEVQVTNSYFVNNSAAFSMIEKELDLPFFRYLTKRKHRLNYFQQSDCTDDELAFIAVCQKKMLYTLNYPISKGAVFMRNVVKVSFENSKFYLNDPGPVLERR